MWVFSWWVLVGIRNFGVAGGKPIRTRERSLQEGLHGRGGCFYVAGARACCRVVSNAPCVLPSDTGNLPPTSVACWFVQQYFFTWYLKQYCITIKLQLYRTTYLLSEYHRSPSNRSLRLPVPYGLHKGICARTVYFSSSSCLKFSRLPYYCTHIPVPVCAREVLHCCYTRY